MAKTSPTEFVNQVKAEWNRVTWPTTRETVMTTIMVVILTTVLGVFFCGVDTLFGWIVRSLLSLASGQS